MNTLQSVHASELLLWLGFLFLCALAPALMPNRSLIVDSVSVHKNTQWIDGLRGISAVLVSVNHAPFVLLNIGITSSTFYIDNGASDIPRFLGALGVQFFFCITGMLFAKKVFSPKDVDWTEFYKRRIKRVVPAYVFAVLLAIVIAVWFTWPVEQDAMEVITLAPGLFAFGLIPTPNINGFNFDRLLGPVWTLAIEWRFYFGLPIIYLAYRKSARLTLGLVTIFAIIDLRLTGQSSWSFFVIGTWCALLPADGFSRNMQRGALLAAVAAIVFMACRIDERNEYGLEQWLNVFTLYAFITIAKPGTLTARVLTTMGAISYSFYLLHCMVLFLVFAAIDRYVTDLGSMPVEGVMIIAGATLALSTVLASVSYSEIESRFMHRNFYTGKLQVHVTASSGRG